MVAPAVIGAGIGAVGNLIGGLIGNSAANKAAQTQWENEKLVYKNQIYWKVQDALRAGIHPLAGLGVNPASGPAPAQVGNLGSSISDMGQNIGRAAEALMTPEDKSAGRLAELAIERETLNNELLRSQIASQRMRNMQQGTPGVSGSAARTVHSPKPSPVTETIPGLPGQWTVSNPGLGGRMEDNYSEWANVLLAAPFAKDALKYLGFERILAAPTPQQLGAQHGQAFRRWWQGNPPPRHGAGGGSGW